MIVGPFEYWAIQMNPNLGFPYSDPHCSRFKSDIFVKAEICINRLRRYSNSLKSSSPATHESIIQRLDSTLATAMAKKIGIPPGLFSCFELEMARLQVRQTVLLVKINFVLDKTVEGQ